MSNEKEKNETKEFVAKRICPKCGQRYVVADGHECPEEKKDNLSSK